MLDLIPELMRTLDIAAREVEALSREGREAAEAEAEYRTAKAEKMLQLRAEGMPATMVGDVARGDRKVASLYVKKMAADALYQATKEAVMLDKKRIDVIREQIDREYRA